MNFRFLSRDRVIKPCLFWGMDLVYQGILADTLMEQTSSDWLPETSVAWTDQEIMSFLRHSGALPHYSFRLKAILIKSLKV